MCAICGCVNIFVKKKEKKNVILRDLISRQNFNFCSEQKVKPELQLKCVFFSPDEISSSCVSNLSLEFIFVEFLFVLLFLV